MKKLIVALLAGAAAMSAAHAEGPYIGVGIATADHTFNVAGATNTKSDGYKASGKIFGGYDLDKTWGVETGYTDYRSSSFNYTGAASAAGRLESSGHSFYVAGKATAPINEQFAVFGKLGAANNKTSVSGTGVASTLGRSDSKTEVYAALGAQYNLSKQVALSLEYERYGKQKDFGAKADVWTVAARYNF